MITAENLRDILNLKAAGASKANPPAAAMGRAGEKPLERTPSLGASGQRHDEAPRKPFRFRRFEDEIEPNAVLPAMNQVPTAPVEDRLARQIEAELQKQNPMHEAAFPGPVQESQPPREPAAAPSAERNSARMLELKRKQQSCSEMRAKFHEGASLFTYLNKHIDLIGSYLEKAEVELSHLEAIEAKSAQLATANANLSRKNEEMQATIEEQTKQISLLENTKSASRETIGHLKSQYAHLLEEHETQSSEIATRDQALVRLESEKLSFLERLDVQERDYNDLMSENTKTREKLTATTMAVQYKDKEILELTTELTEAKRRSERLSIDLSDVQSKYSELKSKYMEQKTQLEEAVFDLGASRSEFEEKLRLKEKRILELESRFAVPHVQSHAEDIPPQTKSDTDVDFDEEVLSLLAEATKAIAAQERFSYGDPDQDETATVEEIVEETPEHAGESIIEASDHEATIPASQDTTDMTETSDLPRSMPENMTDREQDMPEVAAAPDDSSHDDVWPEDKGSRAGEIPNDEDPEAKA